MTDRAFDPIEDKSNPFAKIMEAPAASPAAGSPDDDADNPFAKIMARPAPASSATGAFVRGAVRGATPAIGSIPAIGAGAETGGTIGSFLGPFGAAGGALIGGAAGGLGAGYLISKAQDWALSKLPDSWVEKIGLDERQQKLDERYHGAASFLGGLAPYAVTMRPGIAPKAALPENATALQRIMAHPATAHVFGGAIVGGLELGQEAAHGEAPDWTKVAISTGFGVVFNRPTRIGESLTGIGARPVLRLVGRELPAESTGAPAAGESVTPAAAEATSGTAPPAAAAATPSGPALTAAEAQAELLNRDRRGAPNLTTEEAVAATRTGGRPTLTTVADAADLGVMGPGITEETFHGSHQRSEAAEQTARENKQLEASVIGAPPAPPPIHGLARRMHPELFARYDQLQAQRAEFARWIDEHNNPTDEVIADATGRRDELQRQLDAHIAERGGYAAGPEARRLRANIRDAQREVDSLQARRTAYSEGAAEQTPDLIQARQHLLATDYALHDMRAEVQAAYRRAAEAGGHEIIEPEAASVRTETPVASPEPVVAPAQPPAQAEGVPAAAEAPVLKAAAPPEPPKPRTIEEQRDFIRQDVARQLMRAGRPKEEAEAAGAFIAARYETRAALFKGARGTAEDLYRAKGAEILGPGMRSSQGPLPPRAPSAPRKVNEEKLSLLQFLAHNGGLKRTADLEAMLGEHPFVPGFGRLFREGGMSEDRAREAAEEAGYLVPTHHVQGGGGYSRARTDIKDLHAAMSEESRGRRRYRQGYEPPAEELDPAREEYLREQEELAQDESELFQGKPPTIELQPAGTSVLGTHEINIIRDGEQAGIIRLKPSPDGKNLLVKWITSAGPLEDISPDQLNVFGPAAIRSIMRELKRLYPEAETVSGLRVNPVRQERREAAVMFQRPTEPSGLHDLPGIHIGPNFLSSNELFQPARGKVQLNPRGTPGRDFLGEEGVKPIIRMLRDSNASTFPHESGHVFLAELARDAEHPAAPDQLKADWQTTLKWLGAKSAEGLTRAHHEKFATGFEQYLREGTAPSPGLARVFAQFRQWLLNIYQTIKGLGKPINEDIRGVFDRMLAEEPQRTVIAPEVEAPKSMADIHEEDAALTAPEHADAAMARVASEREQDYKNDPHAPELGDAVARNRPGSETVEPRREAGEGAGGLRDIQLGGEPSGSEPGSGGPGAPAGAKRESGNASGTQSPRVAGRGATAERVSGEEKRTGLDDQPLAPGPADSLDRRESFNVGKNGNIRTENITSVDQFASAIEEAKDRIGGTNEPMTDGQVMDAAQAMGFSPDDLTLDKLVRAFGGVKDLNKKVLAFRMAVRDQAERVGDLMRRLRDEGDNDQLVVEYAKERERFDMFMSVLSSVTTEWGRAGRSFRNLEGWDEVRAVALSEMVKSRTGRTLFQLKMEAKLGAKLDTPAKVAKYLRDAQKRSFGGMLLEYFVNNLISGPATHATYMVGNKLTMFQDAVPETLLASAIGGVRRALGRQGERVLPGEAWQQVKAVGANLPKSLQGALEAVRTGQPTMLPGQTVRPLMPFYGDTSLTLARNIQNDPVTWHELAGDFYAAMKGIRDGIVGGASLVAAGGHAGAPVVGAHWSPLGQIPDVAIRGVPVLPVGSLVRLPGRAVSAIHSFDTIANYSRNIAARAYREAVTLGLDGSARARHIADRTANPPQEWMEAAHKEAYGATLMGEGGNFVKRLSALINTSANIPGIGAIRPLKFIDPFVHIGANVINQAVLKRTPLGIFSEEIRADLMGKNGNIAQDYAQARMLAGTAMAIGFGSLAMEGYITGSGPSDPKEAAVWREVYQPHSVRIGDMWYQVNRLGPLGMHLGIAADLYDVVHDISDGDALTAAAHLQHAITQNILDESFMRGPSELIRALDDPGRYGEAYLKNFLASFVPFSVGVFQMNRAADPYTRQARTVMDSIMQRTPGQSKYLQPRINVWGEEIPSPDAFGHAGLTAIYLKQVNSDPVRQAMLDLGVAPAPVPRKIRNVDLTDEEYTDFARLSGRMAKMRLDTIVRSPDWQSWPNHLRHDVIAEVIKQSREAARGRMMARYPHIVRDAVDDLRERKLGEPESIH